jgi:hypothetical protein
MKPIKPSEVADKRSALIPDAIIACVNDLILAYWNGSSASFTQKDLMKAVVNKKIGITPHEIFEKHYFDFENIFRKAGWRVVYDKPGYNEDYEANFSFSKKSKGN